MEITSNHGTWFVATGLPQIPGVSVPRPGFWEKRRPEAAHLQERCAATLPPKCKMKTVPLGDQPLLTPRGISWGWEDSRVAKV